MSEENTMTDVLGEELEASTDQSNNDNDQNLADQTQEEDYLSQFVGEGKKYQTVEDAAKALAKKAVNADQFIEQLKQEKAELEQKTSEAKTVDDIIAALNKENGVSTEDTSHTEEAPQGLTVDRLEEWYENRQKKAAEEAATQEKIAKIKENQTKAWEILESEEYFGSRESAKAAMRKYLEADPSRKEVVNNLGGYDPQGLATLLKSVVPGEQTNFSDDSGVVSIPDNYPRGRLTWEQVKAKEKENPSLKKDRKWQQYVNAHLEL